MIAPKRTTAGSEADLAENLTYAIELRGVISLRDLADYVSAEAGIVAGLLKQFVEEGLVARLHPVRQDRAAPELVFYRWRRAEEQRFALGRSRYEQLRNFSYHRVCGEEPHEQHD